MKTRLARLQHSQKVFTDWISSLPKPVGLLAFADTPADRFCHWIMAAGLRVPEDVAVLSIGNYTRVCDCSVVPISSIALDTVGAFAAAMDAHEVTDHPTLDQILDADSWARGFAFGVVG